MTDHLAVLFAYLDFPAGAERAHSGAGVITWDGHQWFGVGQVGSAEGVRTQLDVQPSGATLTLSGVPAAAISKVLDDDYQGRAGTIWLATVPAGDEHATFSAPPTIVFSGQMDNCLVELGETCVVQVSLTDELARFRSASNRRYTHVEQQLRYPGDRFFEHVSDTVEKQINWGVRVAR